MATLSHHSLGAGLVALKQLQEDKSSGIKEFVGTILRIHFKYHNMVTSIFSSHKDFTSALDRVSKAVTMVTVAMAVTTTTVIYYYVLCGVGDVIVIIIGLQSIC